MGTDYEKVIRELSSAYDKKGRVGHDSLFASLQAELEEFPYEILKKVVLEEYIEKRGPNNRLFGAFPEWDIRALSIKCNRLEESSSNPLR